MKAQKRSTIEKNGKFYTPRGVELTRNCHTMTESEYFSFLLSALRKTTRFWKPKLKAIEEASRPSQSLNKKIKTEHQCAMCMKWFKKADIQADHIIPCGGIDGYHKIVPWLKKAHIEDGFQVLCKPCHNLKTSQERRK